MNRDRAIDKGVIMRGRSRFTLISTVVVGSLTIVGLPAVGLYAYPQAAAAAVSIANDTANKRVSITNDALSLSVDYNKKLDITSLKVGSTLAAGYPITTNSASYTYSGDNVAQLTDGIVSYTESPRNRWSAYRSPSSSDWVQLAFGTSRLVSSTEIDLFADTSAIRAPQSMSVQYLQGSAWVPVSSATYSPAIPTGNAANRVSFAPIATTALRVVFVHAVGYKSAATEIVARGPGNPVELLDSTSPVASGFSASVPTVSASYTNPSDSANQVVDGIVSYSDSPRNRWTAYNSPNAVDWLALDYGASQTIDSIKVDLFGDASAIRAPQSYNVEYWTGSAWANVSSPAYSPAAPTANTVNTVSFNSVQTSRVRIDFVHASGYKSGATEIESFVGGTKIGGSVSTLSLTADPTVTVNGATVTFSNVTYAPGVSETWTFDVTSDSVKLHVDRTFATAMTLQKQQFLGFSFKEKAFDTVERREDGGSLILLDKDRNTDRFLSAVARPEHSSGSWFDNVRYSIYSTDVDLLDKADNLSLGIAATSNRQKGLTFYRSPDMSSSRALQLNYQVGTALTHPSGTYLPLAVFQSEDFSPIPVIAGQVDTIDYTLTSKPNLDAYYDLGAIPAGAGIDEASLSGMMQDLLRSSVIDSHVGMGDTDVSGMGPYETWWYSQDALGLQANGDQGYLNSLKAFITFIKNNDYPLHGTGQLYAVSARTTPWYKDYFFDTYGQLAAGAANAYQLSGDIAWLQSVAGTIRSSLDWVTARDTNGNGLVESYGTGVKQWDDQTNIGTESAYANIMLAKGLNDWAALEAGVLGDATRAATYRNRAALIVSTLNKPLSQGGFWSASTHSFVHSRDLDGTIHGDVASVMDNATAVMFGFVDAARGQEIMTAYTQFASANNIKLFPMQRTAYSSSDNSQPFPSYLHGNVFPQWQFEMMGAYAAIGDSTSALKLLRAAVDQYGVDKLEYNTYNWDMTEDRLREPWFSANGRAATGFYSILLGIAPQADRLVLNPRLDAALNGTTVSYSTQGHAFTISYADQLTRTVTGDGILPVESRWSQMTPNAQYYVKWTNASGTTQTSAVTSDASGTATFILSGAGTQTVRLSTTP